MNQFLSIPQLQAKKAAGEPLAMVTAYDYTQARIVEEAGVDIILVGDSLGNVILGYDTTIPVTMEDMEHHVQAVARGAKNTFIVADMPFGSYHINTEQAVSNALRLIRAGAKAVKIEGGKEIAPLIEELTARNIPVMGHIGLLPQTATLWEGYRTQGRDEESAWVLIEAAQAMEEAGAFCVLMECITEEVSAKITSTLDVFTIGIGCGVGCDGQVLVLHDLLGLSDRQPRFVRRFAEGREFMVNGIRAYCDAVRNKEYPEDRHSINMPADEAKRL